MDSSEKLQHGAHSKGAFSNQIPNEHILELNVATQDPLLLQLQENIQLFFNLINLSDFDASQLSLTQDTEIPNQEDESLSENTGNKTYTNINYGHIAKVESVPRTLDLVKATSNEVIPTQYSIQVLNTFRPNLSIELNGLTIVNEIYTLPKIGHKHIVETQNSIQFNGYLPGTQFLPQTHLNNGLVIDVNNQGTGPDIATIIDASDNQNQVQNLQTPWPKGNIKNDLSGNLLIIAANNQDSNNDGLIDAPIPEATNPSGTIEFSFDSPVYQFGWDMFNLEYGPEMEQGKVIFYDKHGGSTTVPFLSFIDPNAPFYDATFQFGSASANRIIPINANDLALSEVVKVQFTLPDSVAISNLVFLEHQINFVPNTFTGNVLQNDSGEPNQLSITQIAFTFSDTSSAIAFVQNNPQAQMTALDQSVIITDFAQTIPTPLGGTLKVESNGDFYYQAPNDFSAGVKSEEFIYTIQSIDGTTGQGVATINLQDNLPRANNNDNYTNEGDGQHQYNLVLMLDISGSMNTKLYNQTRLEIAKNAIVKLIQQYDAISQDLKITIVPFGSGDILDGAFSYQATSPQDAIDFVLKQNGHASDGVAIQMINPDTNQAIQTDTFYDHALYHARDTLETDITNPNLDGYQHIAYFLSDGKPFIAHTATDQGDWPAQWGSWLDFINDTKTEVPQSLVDAIQVFAVAVDPDEDINAYVTPVATDSNHILSPDPNLFTFSHDLLATLPSMIQGEVLNNDLFLLDQSSITNISFQVGDAAGFIASHGLAALGAQASADNLSIRLDLPTDGSFLATPTPMNGMLLIDNSGHYQYISGKITQAGIDAFEYTLHENLNNIDSQATLSIHVYPDADPIVRLVGDHLNDNFSSSNQSGIVYFEGGRGFDQFTIDMTNENVPLIYIKDLSNGELNEIIFANAIDKNQDNVINLIDVIDSFSQNGENSNLNLHLNNASPATSFAGTDVILENIGTIAGPQIEDLMDYFSTQALTITFA